MKNRLIKLFLAAGVAVTMVSCDDFQEINQDPNAVPFDKMQIDYMLDASIYGAQMDPDVGERMFVLTWDVVARYESGSQLNTFRVHDDYFTSYWGMGYMGGWLRSVTIAVQIGEQRIADNTITDAERNLYQMSRIWRAYLYTEYADNFGPVSNSQFDGNVKLMSKVEDIYAFVLKELDEASAALNLDVKLLETQAKNEPFFAGNAAKWQKYANSLSLRCAMRIGNQAAFEKAAKLPLITTQDDIAAVQEKGGWDNTTGVMTRSWDEQALSLAYSNIATGLGGVNLTTLASTPGTAAYKMPASVIAKYSKDPQQYIGLRMKNYLSEVTNVGNAGYFMDYIPSTIDPRAVINYSIPGYDDGTVQNYLQGEKNDKNVLSLLLANGDLKDGVTIPKKVADTVSFRTQYTYFTPAPGSTGLYGSNLASFMNSEYNYPCKSKKLRDNNNKRLFFGPWETYFLLAEASLKNWNTNGVSDQAAYESGVKASFTYFNVGGLADAYLASEDYNRVGTSVSYGHLAEATSLTLKAVDMDANLVLVSTDAKTGAKTYKISDTPTEMDVVYNYPKGGHPANNDKLAKIITQKYLANSPWLPLEAWNDYRRLNLPFMENPLVEVAITDMPWYTKSMATTFQFQNVPQRIPYPANLKVTSPDVYASGVGALGGADKVGTPLSWAKKQ